MPPRVSLISRPAIAALGGQLLMDACARFRDRFDGAEIERGRIDQRLDVIQQRPAGLGLAGRNAGLDQHLQFPIAAALLVIAAGAVERNADFAIAAVGTQPQIDAVALAFGGVGGEQLRVLVGDLLEEFFVGHRLRAVGLAVAGVDEHQIDVGAVVQLIAARACQARSRRSRTRRSVFEARRRRGGRAIARGCGDK